MRRALAMLEDRARSGRPLRMGLIGAGTFGTMVLSQAARLPGLAVDAVADRLPARALAALQTAGIDPAGVAVTSDPAELIAREGLEVVVEATGSPSAGVGHARGAIAAGRHVVMVNVEADALAGPLLAREAATAGVAYGLAFGDQPALIADLVDWARASGFEVVAAGKGTRYLPAYHHATPDTVWDDYGLSAAQVEAGGYNARMFTSFLDGTKSAIEMAAVANATGLSASAGGLGFPPCGAERLSSVCIPRVDGGALTGSGLVEVVSSLERDGRPVAGDLRWGVWVTFRAHSAHVARCFADYGLSTDPSGRYAAMWRPYHLIGLETTVSVLRAGLLGEPTGCPDAFRADVVAVAKRDLAAGEELDGEGGFTVWGRLAPAGGSLAQGALPIGLAHGARLARPVARGEVVRTADAATLPPGPGLDARREMEEAARAG